MTRQELIAWAAGFFDGEGSSTLISPSRRDRNHQYQHLQYERIEVSQAGLAGIPEVLRRCQDLFGGKIVGGPRRSRPGHKPIYVWYVSGMTAHLAMAELLPYLSEIKQEQWDKVCVRASDKRHLCSCGLGKCNEFTGPK